MRKLVYCVAASLDGFIAGPQGESDWIVPDPAFDFNALYARFDVALMGRATYEWMQRFGEQWMPPMKVIVCSQTLQPDLCPGASVERDAVAATEALKQQPGKDIWLFGGGVLFAKLLEAGLVDTIEVAVMPVLLGDGIPILQGHFQPAALELTGHKAYAAGLVSLTYAVKPK